MQAPLQRTNFDPSCGRASSVIVDRRGRKTRTSHRMRSPQDGFERCLDPLSTQPADRRCRLRRTSRSQSSAHPARRGTFSRRPHTLPSSPRDPSLRRGRRERDCGSDRKERAANVSASDARRIARDGSLPYHGDCEWSTRRRLALEGGRDDLRPGHRHCAGSAPTRARASPRDAGPRGGQRDRDPDPIRRRARRAAADPLDVARDRACLLRRSPTSA